MDGNPKRESVGVFGSCETERCEELASYIIKTGCTVRAAAAHFGISKSTVHKDITKILRGVNYGKYSEVKKIIEKNKSERHLRGGLATKIKYQRLKEK